MSNDQAADQPPERPSSPPPGTIVRNMGEPIKLAGVNLAGISGEAAHRPAQIKVITRLAITSDQRMFHRIAESMAEIIESYAQNAGTAVRLSHAGTVLLVVHPDQTAELWIDTAAESIQVIVKSEMFAGTVMFENDIADIVGFDFPLVNINPDDSLFCLFRKDWRFGLFFDFKPDGARSRQDFAQTLGWLYRDLRYRHLYDTIADIAVFERIVAAGWFPFVEIIGREFRSLASSCASKFPLDDEEVKIIARIRDHRIEAMLARWLTRPHFAARERLLKSAVNAFKADEPVATIKIVLTEIEGILNAAHRQIHGKGAKLKKLLEFAVGSAEQRAGSADTLLLPTAFAHYLKSYTFADFDPSGPAGHAGSRHAVGHGVAEEESYTMTRALQALLTLDQLAFYT